MRLNMPNWAYSGGHILPWRWSCLCMAKQTGKKRPGGMRTGTRAAGWLQSLSQCCGLAVEPSLAAAVRRHQIDALTRHSAMVGAINLVNSLLLASMLREAVPGPLLAAWVGAVWVLWGYLLWHRWRRRHAPPPPAVKPATVRRAIAYAAIAGALWGLASPMVFITGGLQQQLILAFVVGGMCAGAIATLSSFPAICYAYVLPATIPAVIGFVAAGTSTTLVMTAMVVIFIASLLLVMRRGFATVLSGIRAQTHNQDLMNELSTTHARLVDALESVPAGIVVCDLDDRVVACNSRFRSWMTAGKGGRVQPGTPYERVLARTAATIFRRGAGARKQAWIEKRMARHRSRGQPDEITLADGRVVRIHERPTADGGTVSVFLDISDLKENQIELTRQSNLMRAILDHMAQGLVVFDEERHVITANHRVSDLLDAPAEFFEQGRSIDDLIGFSIDRDQYDERTAATVENFRKAAEKGKSFQVIFRRHDGRTIETHCNPMPDGGHVVTYTDVTDHKRAEDARARYSALLQATLDNMGQGLIVFDSELTILAVNQRAMDMLNMPKEVLHVGASFTELIEFAAQRGDYGAGNSEEVVERVLALATGTIPHTFDRTMPGGVILEARAQPRPEGGHVITYTDITERRHAEQRILRAERQLRDGIESIRDGFLLLDADDRVVMHNRRWVEIYDHFGAHNYKSLIGVSFEEILRVSAERGLVGGDDPQTWLRERMERHRHPGDEPVELQLADGRTMLVSERSTSEGGTVLLHTDITALKRAETRLTDAVECLPDCFALFDADDRLVLFNPKYREAFGDAGDIVETGITFEEIIRRGIDRGQFLEAKGREEAFIAERVKEHQTLGRPLEMKMGNGRWYRIEERRTREGGIVGARVDVTELKEREAARQRSEEELARRVGELENLRERLEAQGSELRELAGRLVLARDEAHAANKAKSDFLANMSHELRTPLNAILGFSEIMSQELLGPLGNETYRQYLNDIHESGAHLLSLINDILDISKIEAGRMELHEDRIALREIVDASVRLIRERAETGEIKLVVSLARDLPDIRADARAIKQILLNLLSNAVKFTEAGGQVEVRIETPTEDGVAIAISDNGVGMSEADVKKALIPFGQVDSSLSRKHSGTGLGLPLVRSLAELHGGRLEVVSEPGTGTMATVILPPERLLEPINDAERKSAM
jgi:signal transduction histidine kinase